MKKITIILLVLASMFLQAQKKQLVLAKNSSDTSIIISENKRILVETKDDTKHRGKFTIINESTISINNNNILLKDIVKTRTTSTFSQIFTPIAITAGIILTGGGVVFIAIGGIATIVGVPGVLLGVPTLALSVINNNHKPSLWTYTIENASDPEE